MQVWNRLGLRLLRIDGSNEYPNRTYFSIQHPDLSSALVPDTTTVARFHSVSYSIDLAQVQKKGHPAKRTAKVAKMPKRTTLATSQTENVPIGGGDADYNRLTLDDQRAVDEFIANMKLDVDVTEGSRRAKRRRSQHSIVTEILDAAYIKDIVEACLENIMVGIRRCPKNLKLTDRSPGKALAELVPGVFNIPYLKVRLLKNRLVTLLTAPLEFIR